MADVLDIENSEEFEVDEDGERKSHFHIYSNSNPLKHATFPFIQLYC